MEFNPNPYKIKKANTFGADLFRYADEEELELSI